MRHSLNPDPQVGSPMLPSAEFPGPGAGGEEGGGAEDQEEVPRQTSAHCGEVQGGQEYPRDGQGVYKYKTKPEII